MNFEFTTEQAQQIGDILVIDWDTVDLEEFRMGLGVELEHGSLFGGQTNVTDDDWFATGRIALAHLYELPNYYTLLEEMEQSAMRYLLNNRR